MIYATIIEDEMVYAEHLKSLLYQWAEDKTELDISVYLNSADFFHKTTRDGLLNIDIMFIDIVLDESDGIAVAKRIRDFGFKNTIVFTTNVENRAIDGYFVNAYRYYLKPLLPRDIKECMNYVLTKNANDYFQYTYHGITNRIAFNKILSFESSQHYVDIFTTQNTIRIKSLLKEVQKQCPINFIRCHRSYIVNSNYIQCRQGNKLTLKNGRIINISPPYSKAVSKIMALKKE